MTRDDVLWLSNSPGCRVVTSPLNRKGPLRFPPKFQRAIVIKTPELHFVTLEVEQHRAACEFGNGILLIRECDLSDFRPGPKFQEHGPLAKFHLEDTHVGNFYVGAVINKDAAVNPPFCSQREHHPNISRGLDVDCFERIIPCCRSESNFLAFLNQIPYF